MRKILLSFRRHLTEWKKNEYNHPYLMWDLNITRSNQVREVDVKYIPMAIGFMYLTAIADVCSRYIAAGV